MNCDSYYYHIKHFKKGLFDKYIDMIYILTMEGSTRMENIYNMMNKYKLHSTITIQFNIGFKKCKKKLYQQTTIYDINDAYYHCFLDATNKKYKNIIILEDDCIFDTIIMNQDIVNEIGFFINNHTFDVYHLSPLVHLSIPYTLKHHRCFYMLTAHSCIYNSRYFQYYINRYDNIMINRNDMIWNNINIIKYKYYRPLSYQLFPVTENQKHWINIFFKYSIMIFKLDKYYFPGYMMFNILLYVIIIITLIILCFK